MVASASPLNAASLVDASLHSPALLELLDIKIAQPIIHYTVGCVVEAVDYAMGRPTSSTPRAHAAAATQAPKFTEFVTNVLTRAEVTTPTLLATLAYIDRARPHLSIALEEWAAERVFLGALMAASKYLNDSTLKNVHWAMCTGVFGKRDVGRIEREFLDVLDFQLSVSESDLLAHHTGLAAVALPHKLTTRRHKRTYAASAPDLTTPATEQTKKARSWAPEHEIIDVDAIPDLEFSRSSHHHSHSPSSSCTSSSSDESPSPRTPEVLMYPSTPVLEKERAQEMQSHPRKHHGLPLPSMKELLRSFPIPRHHQGAVSIRA